MNPAATEADRDPDRRAEPTRCVPSGFIAAVWWKLAPNPDGTCLVRGGGWCQGLGSFYPPWKAQPALAACIRRLCEAPAALLNSTPVRPLESNQESVRQDLSLKMTVDGHSRFD